MLASLTSAQVADWMAFAKLEQVGEPYQPNPEDVEKAQRKTQRAKVEGGLRALANKQKQQGL